MGSCIRLAAFSLLFFFIKTAMAGNLISSTTQAMSWHCWYDQKVHITCLIDDMPAFKGLSIEERAAKLPFIVKALQADPELLRQSFVQIPLLTQPYEDREFTAMLAQVTVCGTYPNCTVDFSNTAPSQEVIAAFLERNDPAATGEFAMAMLDH